MKYRCINNLFGYCQRKPDAKGFSLDIDQAIGLEPVKLVGCTVNTCTKDWYTCPAFLSWSQECERFVKVF